MREQTPKHGVGALRVSLGNPEVPIYFILMLDLTFSGRFYDAELSSAHLDSLRIFVGERYE
jgi:hypothetical protein